MEKQSPSKSEDAQTSFSLPPVNAALSQHQESSMETPLLTLNGKRQFVVEMRARYLVEQGKKARSLLIDEMCAVCGYERKYAIKVLRGKRNGALGERRGGPKRRYDMYKDAEVLKAIWLGTRRPSIKRLKELVPAYLAVYEQDHGILEEEQRARLLKMSASTIHRLLAPLREKTTA